MKKRGQFYIIAAIIIVGIVLASVGIRNYVITKKQQSRIYDLGKELNLETAKVLDYGIIQVEENKRDELLKNWINTYIEHLNTLNTASGENKTYVFVFGDEKGNLTILSFSTISIPVSIGGSNLPLQANTLTINKTYVEGGKIKITLNNVNYDFDIKPGKNFYFVISTEEATINKANA